MAPDRHSMTEMHRATGVTDGFLASALSEDVVWIDPSTIIPSGDFVTKNEGGQEDINPVGTTGPTEDIDPTAGNVPTSTLGDDTVFTILQPVGSGAASLEHWVSTGAGGFTPTWDADGGTFQWDGTTPTLPTTAGVTYRVILERIPGTTNDWIGNLVGGSASASGRWELAVIPGSPPDSLYADGDWLYIFVP